MARTSPAKEKAKFSYEFGGPIGALATVLSLPLVIYGLYIFCNESDCLSIYPLHIPAFDISNLEFWNPTAFYVVLGWLAFQAVLAIILPGEIAEGVVLENGKRLKYKLNGFFAFVVSIVAVIAGHYFELINLRFVYEHYLALATAAIIVSYGLAVYLYLTSFGNGKLLARGGNSGNPIYDFYMGRELNPRIGSFDLKVFCELRPGLIGWVILDLALAVYQYQEFNAVSNAMVLVGVFQTIYVADALWSEKAILTTMDVTTDGFGFMLAFGDLAWVPFTYTVQARYLASRTLFQWDYAIVGLLILLKVIGYYTFRGANGQKDQFRRDPNHPSVKHLKTLTTSTGRKLIISGWWGVARHINYVGDWIMAWSWCLPCGTAHIIPYFYVIYFAILLIHRDLRDEHACKLKYGKDWDKYCSIVKYRFIPYIY